MAIVSQLLQNKGHDIWSVTPEATIYEALQLMAEKNAGALIVMADEQAVGVLSERDYARKVVLHGRASRTTLVKEIMAAPVISVNSADSVEKCMEVMTASRIRHLLVVDNQGQPAGVISIGDVVKAVINEQQAIINHLEDYITS
jgi:CBS domain-containing protein